MLRKIISGGQPGVEIAALDAALKLDLELSASRSSLLPAYHFYSI